MNARLTVVVLGMLGSASTGMAADLASLPVSSKRALHCKTRQDYISAMLSYDEVLRKDPFNQKEMRKLMACHEAMLAQERLEDQARQSVAQASLKASHGEMPDLPDLMPEPDPRQLVEKP